LTVIKRDYYVGDGNLKMGGCLKRRLYCQSDKSDKRKFVIKRWPFIFIIIIIRLNY